MINPFGSTIVVRKTWWSEWSRAREVMVVLVVMVVLGLVDWVGVAAPVRNGQERLINRWQGMVVQGVQVVWGPVSWWQSHDRLARRVQDLELRYSIALAEFSELEGLRQENQSLRELLENADRSLAVSTISSPLVSVGFPTLAHGEDQGLRPGQMVLVGQTLVGRLSQVSQHQSEVELLSMMREGGVLAKTESGVEGLIRGDGWRVIMTEVPPDTELKVGERVVTLGQPGIEADTLIGTIQSVKLSRENSVQEAVIEQHVSFYHTRIVEVR